MRSKRYFFVRFYQSTKYFPFSILRANALPKIFHSNSFRYQRDCNVVCHQRNHCYMTSSFVVEYYVYPPFLVPRCSFCGGFSYDKDAVT